MTDRQYRVPAGRSIDPARALATMFGGEDDDSDQVLGKDLVGKTGAEVGMDPTGPFADVEVISAYTVDDAVNDGMLVRLGPTLTITTNAARTVVGGQLDAEPETAARLKRIVSALVSEYTSGRYSVPAWADESGEADAGLAVYLVDVSNGRLLDDCPRMSDEESDRRGLVKVWAMPGGGCLQLLLPEDY